MSISKKEFFQKYLTDEKTLSINNKVSKLFYSKDVEILSENRIKTYIIIEFVTNNLFQKIYRHELIHYIKHNYEQKSWYLFFIDKIDYEQLMKYKLPLIFPRQDSYIHKIPILAEIIFYQKNQIVEMTLILKFEDEENKNVYANNQYLESQIELNHNQILERDLLYKEDIIHDKNNNQIYKNKTTIFIKIKSFQNIIKGQFFGKKIFCIGEIVNSPIIT